MQPLPFSIEVKDFCIGHYANGQPKSFASDLVIHDPERGEAAGYENYMAPLAMDGRRFFSVVYGRRPANRFVTLYTRRCNGSRDVAAGILDACLTVMQTLPVDLYAELLADYGVDLTQGISARDGALFDDVVNAMGALCSYGVPACILLGSLQHIQSTGLQIARTPGKKLVDNVTGRWVYASNTG